MAIEASKTEWTTTCIGNKCPIAQLTLSGPNRIADITDIKQSELGVAECVVRIKGELCQRIITIPTP